MKAKITDCNISNCCTGIKAEGVSNLIIDKSTFSGNGRDIVIKASADSETIISNMESVNCETTSISITEYNHIIEEADSYAKASGEFSEEELEEFGKILHRLKETKDDPSKTKKIMREIYSVGKACIPAIVSFLIANFKWS